MDNKAYIIIASKVPDETPDEIIRAYVSQLGAIDFFKLLTGVDDQMARRSIGGEWVMNRRLLDDDNFYRIVETDLG